MSQIKSDVGCVMELVQKHVHIHAPCLQDSAFLSFLSVSFLVSNLSKSLNIVIPRNRLCCVADENTCGSFVGCQGEWLTD